MIMRVLLIGTRILNEIVIWSVEWVMMRVILRVWVVGVGVTVVVVIVIICLCWLLEVHSKLIFDCDTLTPLIEKVEFNNKTKFSIRLFNQLFPLIVSEAHANTLIGSIWCVCARASDWHACLRLRRARV